MVYLYLALAVAFEAGWAILLKISQAPQQGQAIMARGPALGLAALSYVLSFIFLALATRRLDIGVVYAVWVGLGTALIVGFGIVVLKEPATLLKLVCIGLIIAGCVGLNLESPHAPATPALSAPPPAP